MFADFFIRRPVFASVCAFLIVLIGAVCIPQLPTDYYPPIAPPQVNVVANYTGASAEVVETAVTNILERQINGVQGMRYIQSTSSSDGTSNITVTFEPNRNADNAAIDVQNRVAQVQAQLPEAVTRNGVSVTKVGGSSFLMFIGLSSEKGEYDTLFISNYVDQFIRDPLRRIKGVGDIQIFGERRYAMRLWVDPVKLTSRNLTVQDVVEAVQDQNIQVAAGKIGQQPADPNQVYQLDIIAQGQLVQPEEFGNIVLRSGSDGSLVRVKDVARVELGAQDYNSSFRLDGIDAVGIGVLKLVDANALDVAQAVRRTMDELSKTLPPGMVYQIPYDTTLFINESIREVAKALLEAIGLVVLTIFVFLQNWRTTLIPAITIPVSLIGTFAFMRLFGFSINTLTMFGLTLATGLVVDDAIVVVENITRYIEESGMRPLAAASAAMREIFSAVIATSLVLLAVFVPVAFFPGTTGIIYQQFALTIAASVVISTFSAVTLAPALAVLLIRSHGESRFFLLRWFRQIIDGIQAWYGGALQALIDLRWLILGLFTASLGVTVWVYTLVPTGFVPQEDQGYFINFIQGPPGTSLSYTDRIIDQTTQILKQDPNIDAIVGVGGFSFSGSSPNNGLVFGAFKPWSERTRPDQSAEAVIGRLTGPLLGGITGAFVFPINPPAIPELSNTALTFQLQDRGVNDFQVLQQTALGLFFASQQVPSLQLNFPTFSANDPQVKVNVDRDQTQLLQIPVPQVFNTLQTMLGGTYVNNFDFNNRNYRVYVQADQPFRATPEDINRFYVRSDQGAMVPLSNVLSVQSVTGPSIISHYNLFRSAEIGGGAKPGFSSGEAIQSLQGLASQILPQGMGYEWSGLTLEELTSGGQALYIFGLGIVFVFLVLAAQYESYVDPLIIMLVVPLGVLGAMLALLIRGIDNNIFCQVGLVMLIGLASKNSILIVEFANQLREQGVSMVQAVIQASVTRFRAILMTSFSFILGSLPLLEAKGAGAVGRQALGTTVFGGLLVATILSLFVVPVLYVIICSLRDALLPPRATEAADGEAASLRPDLDPMNR